MAEVDSPTAKANRAINLSGVPADMVEERVKEHFHQVSTPAFLKSGLCHAAPALVAGWRLAIASQPCTAVLKIYMYSCTRSRS